MKIKTIVTRLDAAEEFDRRVNEALNDGWILQRREVLQQSQPMADTYFRPMLYAELIMPDEPVGEAENFDVRR